MNVEERLVAVEKRLQAAEDQLEIIRLLATYGPLADSGEAEAAAALWVDGGGYSFNGEFSGGMRLAAPAELVALYESEGHQAMVHAGVSHFTGMPRITLNGDNAEALGYSLVISKEGDRWILWRTAINHWILSRTPDGWRIVERFNRTVEGTEDSHAVMRKAVS